ncbi:hypothetical protein FCM35_KLT11276 [Carex littledalei]|uniref:Uncharacterized protein n=1 Tax=Carex littledalei TaxID=544730 RepID=A0A833QLX3_9POAL|nr:hypothetical protein FCM35_KLT11276 [Carex littledalei]
MASTSYTHPLLSSPLYTSKTSRKFYRSPVCLLSPKPMPKPVNALSNTAMATVLISTMTQPAFAEDLAPQQAPPAKKRQS